MKTIRNLTPHPVCIHAGDRHVTLPVYGPAPRLDVSRSQAGNLVIDGEIIPVVRSQMGMPSGLPYPEPGVILIVSALVAEHPSLVHRTDLAYPGEAIRDEAGRVVGCRGLCAGPGLAGALQPIV